MGRKIKEVIKRILRVFMALPFNRALNFSPKANLPSA
jgi:hypothetical protein